MIAYLEAENAYTEALTAATSRCATPSSPRSRPGPRRPTSRCRAMRPSRRVRVLVLRPDHRGLGVLDLLPAPAADRADPRLEGDRSGEEVLLDGNAEAEGTSSSPSGRSASPIDGRLLAYSVDLTGDERFTLLIKDLATGELLPTTDRGHRVRRGLGPGRPPVLHPRRRGLAAVRGAAPPAGHRPGRGRDRAHRARRAVLARGRQQPGRTLGDDRLRGASSPRSTGCSAPTIRRASRGSCTAPAGREYDVEPAGDRLLIVHNDGAEDFALARSAAGRDQSSRSGGQ